MSSPGSPAMQFPPDDGSTLAPGIIVMAVVSWVIAFVCVAARLYTRTKIVHVRGTEDWTIIVALIFSIGNSAGLILLTRYGWGRHVWLVAPDDFVNLGKTNFAMSMAYQTSLAFTKISILFLYLRILTYHNARWATWIVLAIVIIYNVVGVCLQLTHCTPLEKLWDTSVYGTCHPESFLWAVVGLHIATDFIIFALPIPIITNMTMRMREKLTLLVLFGLGFFTCAISIIRAIWIKSVIMSSDFTRDFIPISHLNCVEVNIAIVCACLMTFKPLISKLWPGWMSSGSVATPLELKDHSNGADSDRPRTVGSKPSNHRLHPVEVEIVPDMPAGARRGTSGSDGDVAAMEVGEDSIDKPSKGHLKKTEVSMV